MYGSWIIKRLSGILPLPEPDLSRGTDHNSTHDEKLQQSEKSTTFSNKLILTINSNISLPRFHLLLKRLTELSKHFTSYFHSLLKSVTLLCTVSDITKSCNTFVNSSTVLDCRTLLENCKCCPHILSICICSLKKNCDRKFILRGQFKEV